MSRPTASEAVAYLRGIGMPEESLTLLADGKRQAIIDGQTLMEYTRPAYVAGIRHAADPYHWYSVEELVDLGRGVALARG